VQVNVKYGGLAGFFANDMVLPNFFNDCLGHKWKTRIVLFFAGFPKRTKSSSRIR
jgi:hypothetical protein